MPPRHLANLRIALAVGLVMAAARLAVSSPGTPAQGRVLDADLCVYGGTPAGIAAAAQASRMGKTAVILEPSRHLGGMPASGLCSTDIGWQGSIGGFAREFYRRVYAYYTDRYGATSPQVAACAHGFRFEPHVAEELYRKLAADSGADVRLGEELAGVRKSDARIAELVTRSGSVVRAGMYVDASYEGDLMAKTGVAYTVGREANAKYGELLNGVHFGYRAHNFRADLDPFVREGDAASGLLKGIFPEVPEPPGTGDRRIQAYCFRMCLTDVPDNRLPFPKPATYDAGRYAILTRYLRAGVWDAVRFNPELPNRKTDTNSHGAFSTDYIGGSYEYPEGDDAARKRIIQDHAAYQQGLMWFLGHDPQVPQPVRDEVNRWGLAKDEFTDNGGWPYQLYVREARRMLAGYVMTEWNCRGREVAPDSVGLASYQMDSHNVRRLVVGGHITNEGDAEYPTPAPYPISYRSIVPAGKECGNLVVPVCLSASHIAYGSIRMEPVFMILGQSAGTAASLAIDAKVPVQQVDVAKLQARLVEDGQVLRWPPHPRAPAH